MVVLRDVKFAQYGKSIVEYVGKFITQVRKIITKVIAELNSLPLVHDWVVPLITRLEALEREFYGVQTSAIQAIPKALAELDARLMQVLNDTLGSDQRLAHAGIPAPVAAPHQDGKSQSTQPKHQPFGHTRRHQACAAATQDRRETESAPRETQGA
jgi:hypothetical protein